LISPNLQKIFKFLIDIGEELNSFLDIETNIWDMKKNVLNPMLGEWKDML
jgi:hypothetical protein